MVDGFNYSRIFPAGCCIHATGTHSRTFLMNDVNRNP